MTLFKRFAGALMVAAVLLAGHGLFAQATITPTTTTAAITATQTFVPVTSASSIAKGYTLVIDDEAMVVLNSYVSGTTIPVARAQGSTAARAHPSAALVYMGPGNYFSAADPPAGLCTAANEVALPRIVVGTRGVTPPMVSIYNCVGRTAATATWQIYSQNGYSAFTPASDYGLAGVVPLYTSAGAISLVPGVSTIGSAGALAMTLANPTRAQDGMIMTIYAVTAQAHTITNSTGFFGTGGSSDVCTLGGAIGDFLQVQAWASQWWAIATRNCTIN